MAIIYNGTELTSLKFGDTQLTTVYYCDTRTTCCTLVFPDLRNITVPDCVKVGFPNGVYFNYNTAAIYDSICYPGFDIFCKHTCSSVCSYFATRGNNVPLCTCITITGSLPTGVCLIAYPQDADVEQDSDCYKLCAINNSCPVQGVWNSICSVTFSPVTINSVGTHNITNSYTTSFLNENLYLSCLSDVLGTCVYITYCGIDICSCVLYDLYVGTTKELSRVPASCINNL